MTRIIISGCSGHMGHVLKDLIAADPETTAVAGIDPVADADAGFPVFPTAASCDVPADVIIDFSNYRAADALLDYAAEKKIPLVLCTTGLTDEQVKKVGDTSAEVAILRSANMSLGINLLLKLLREAAAKLAPSGFDMEIVEKHHNRKLDAPSGTALALGESMNEALGNQYHFVFDRSQRHEKRDPKEIGISSVRGGSIVGEHDVIFAGQDEVITLSHTAYSRAIFGKGAVEAAKFLAGKPAGLYDMSDLF